MIRPLVLVWRVIDFDIIAVILYCRFVVEGVAMVKDQDVPLDIEVVYFYLVGLDFALCANHLAVLLDLLLHPPYLPWDDLYSNFDSILPMSDSPRAVEGVLLNLHLTILISL